jgi:leucyl/phenylalanyl-tRNA--protein transferase
MFARPLFGGVTWWAPPICAGSDPQMAGRFAGVAAECETPVWRVTLDRDSDKVVAACARSLNGSREGGRPTRLQHLRTGFSPRLMRAMAALHDLGIAHSFEVWDTNDQLVAGGYGVSVGAVFVCEGLFSHFPEAARVGFAILNEQLAEWGYVFCAADSGLLNSINRPVAVLWRSEYVRLIRAHLGGGRYGRWRSERRLAVRQPPPIRRAA